MMYFRNWLTDSSVPQAQTVGLQINKEHKPRTRFPLVCFLKFSGGWAGERGKPKPKQACPCTVEVFIFTFAIKTRYSSYMGFNRMHNKSRGLSLRFHNGPNCTSADNRPDAARGRGRLCQQGAAEQPAPAAWTAEAPTLENALLDCTNFFQLLDFQQLALTA